MQAILQQGHTPAYYRDHPQDIRHRTVQSRKPPPLPTKLIKADPDSATSPSKYPQGQVPDNALSANHADSSDSESTDHRAKKKKLPKLKKKKASQPAAQDKQQPPKSPDRRGSEATVITKQAQELAEREFQSSKKVWSQNRDLLNRDIQKFIHKSKAKFGVDDVKHAMDNARILHRAESVSEMEDVDDG